MIVACKRSPGWIAGGNQNNCTESSNTESMGLEAEVFTEIALRQDISAAWIVCFTGHRYAIHIPSFCVLISILLLQHLEIFSTLTSQHLKHPRRKPELDQPGKNHQILSHALQVPLHCPPARVFEG